jgi:diadenosine tetraphosphate (Ap4A) HIT family hydrolase
MATLRNKRTQRKKDVDLTNATLSKRSNYGDVIAAIIKAGHCPFCTENFLKYHTKPILKTGTYWIVTQNAWPYEGTTHHFLLVSVPHIESIADTSKESWNELHAHIAYLQKKFKLKGKSLLMRSGEPSMTGASVRHLHAQLIVGKPRDKKTTSITALVGFKK